jgi:hypothetical protein
MYKITSSGDDYWRTNNGQCYKTLLAAKQAASKTYQLAFSGSVTVGEVFDAGSEYEQCIPVAGKHYGDRKWTNFY